MEDDKSVNKGVEFLERAQDALFDKFCVSLASDNFDADDKCLDLIDRLQLI